MLRQTILIDTNIFISHDRGESRSLIELHQLQNQNKCQLAYTPLTLFEYFVGVGEDPQIQSVAKRQFAFCQEVNFDSEVALIAASFQRCYQVGFVDSILAAICLKNHFWLATLNHKHFKMIPGVKIWQPTP